ncbi:hypothetical protein BDN67DRAFT_381096 [Paxillus ammoniavirescens]|nr:hypothetical protein BDN67DRAFT_381096 [Paxillus ammoniavirescens]
MHFLHRLLAVLRIASRSLRRLIVYLVLRVPSLLRRALSPPNCTPTTLHSTDHSQVGSRLSLLPTSVTTGPITSTSSGNLTSRTQSPSLGNLHPSSSACLQVSYPPSSISQSAGNASTQLFQDPSQTPSCKPSLPDQMKRYKRAIQIRSATPLNPLPFTSYKTLSAWRILHLDI